MAVVAGTVTEVTDSFIVVNDRAYSLRTKTTKLDNIDEQTVIFPRKDAWQEPIVKVGDQVSKKQLLD